MSNRQTTLCVFIHYGTTNCFPHNVQVYVNELSNYFDEVRILANERPIEKEPHFRKNVTVSFGKNEGYDFGQFYRFIMQTDLSQYSKIALVNDSNILLKKLEKIIRWGASNKADFWGLIDSNERPWFSTNLHDYHIQSHFLVFTSRAIQKLPAFFETIDMEHIFNEKDQKQLRRLVIDQWEIGLSQYLINAGLTKNTYFKSAELALKYKTSGKNNAHTLSSELIAEGYPLLKKKIFIHARKNSGRSVAFWEKIILTHRYPDPDIHLTLGELHELRNKNMNRLHQINRFVRNKLLSYYYKLSVQV